MHAMANMALRAARRAGDILLHSMDRLDELKIEEKAPNDFVSNVDRESEAVIVEVLHRAYPNHAILGEEQGLSVTSESDEFTWIIDPLDGTLNYLRGIPHFCVSIALRKGRHIEHGVIVDPVRNEEWVASRGSGAHLNGKRIRVSKTQRLSGAVLSTGIPPRAMDRFDVHMGIMKHMTRECLAIRRQGSAALDLAYTAAGRVDGYWEIGLKSWDIAAGSLLVKEAGGFVSDLQGGDKYLDSGDIVAANPKCFKAMVAGIRPHL